MEQVRYEPPAWAELDDCLFWIRSTQLQIERFVESLLGGAGSDDARARSKVVTDGHFLLIAAAQTEKALMLAGRRMDPERSTTLRSLRNIHEHWEDHRLQFVSPRLPKERSGARFAKQFPEAIPWNYKWDGTGTYISALRLEDLWQELLDAEAGVESELLRMRREQGLQTTGQAEPNRPFPSAETEVLAVAMVAQPLVIHFDEADPEGSELGT